MKYNEEFIDLLLDIENIKSPKLKYNIQTELKNSLISTFQISNSIELELNQLNKSNHNQNMFSQLNFIQLISNGISNSNILNDFTPDYNFDDNFYNLLNELNKNGAKFNSEYIIEIKSKEIVFPICCIGKNRSQYIFYYLKKLEIMYPNHFVIGYPSSGDELSVIADYLNSQFTNPNILSSYLTQYKKDSFSTSISKSFGITNPDNFPDIPRSIHIFDKVLKKNEPYENKNLKNFEFCKYNTNKYDIFDKNNYQIYEKIIKLYIKYFFTPTNLLDLVNLNINYKMEKITYICMSDKSFYNICMCFSTIKKTYPQINLNNIRIVYFGIQDIFQRSSIKDIVLCDFKQKIIKSINFFK